jgi:hypothetical protein
VTEGELMDELVWLSIVDKELTFDLWSDSVEVYTEHIQVEFAK